MCWDEFGFGVFVEEFLGFFVVVVEDCYCVFFVVGEVVGEV